VLVNGLFFLGIFSLTTARAKKVDFDNEFIYVSSCFRKDKIKLTQIKKINEHIFMKPRMATIVLESPSKFGKKIKYIQRTSFFLFWDTHPDTILLQKMIKKSANQEFGLAKTKKNDPLRLFAE